MTQHYIGTKVVLAWPQDGGAKLRICGRDCTQGDGNCNGYCIGDAERPPAVEQVAGYAVKYEDGYTSWSPKDVFEASYVAMGHVGGMAAYQQRVVGERAALEDKCTKLSAYTVAGHFQTLPSDEQARLTRQLSAMTTYLDILDERITAWGAQ